uniref:Coatomer subunit beta' n=1 Tax=Compsopogon caeruleus TaxID=31354 RepID=A0A7S1TH96_9RHOD|mmetsp:Transcript_406/g.702  ORF Transcript_406/g.702 Transcript_406/m.702 type:complete len:857 (+) Transcript_406:155-2725(+)|eukprot:CAMPEP_0184689052 /NCGR_PEP_ID=MMETSP0312-20130426/30438_1 /TAXON_ID=31354 /ORGANISM="Compsopogon coeruleus, Strain SAG 36.94" /LENGTH=856 /DNA_ID=CAMNT_0027146349 /DNA_START=116 /DNA_END=2686 /DNA_ORIENTATION=+
MPLRLDIKKLLNARSERVKCVDIHPTEPWVLSALYDGNVYIYDYSTQAVAKSFEVCEQPVRCAKFIARKQWVVCGSDDMVIRVYNYNTMEKVKMFEAHMDYIRSLSVHPSLPYLLSASDDMLIKLWDWEKGWVNTAVFEGHSHYVMNVVFNPKDSNTFASASLDHTVKVWNLSSPVPNFTLEGHEKGVNCLDYYPGPDKPYLVTGGDDKLVKVWDYQTKACVQTLEAHDHNISCVLFLPDRPLILSGSEDGAVNLWHSNTYRLEQSLNYALDRCWSASAMKGTNTVSLGFDNGSVVIRLGKDTPTASMDSTGKVIIAKHNEVFTLNVRNADASGIMDGERLAVPVKDFGSIEIYPQKLEHSPNGRFVSVYGDGEYIIYTAVAWRNKSYGAADEVVWDSSVGEYATRVGSNDIRVFNKSFVERSALRPAFPVEEMYGGACLGLRAADFIVFFDWETLELIQRIDVVAQQVFWSDAANLVIITSETCFYMLKFNRDVVDAKLEANRGSLGPDGAEGSFEPLHEFGEKVSTGKWVGDCFVYCNSSNRLNYCVGSEVSTLFHLDRPLYLLGYLPKENRLYLVDKESNVITYQLLLSVLEYKTAVVRGDMSVAQSLVENIPKSEHNKLARFLESQGLKKDALAIATDPDYRCDLAIGLGEMDTAVTIARQFPSESKWRQLGTLAVSEGDFVLAEECMKESNDLSGLATMYSSQGNRQGLEELAKMASVSRRLNVAFMCHFMLNNLSQCLDLLIESGRIAEAAIFARTYIPSHLKNVVGLWKSDLRKSGNVRVADAIADPAEHKQYFPDIEEALHLEEVVASRAAKVSEMSASDYRKVMAEEIFSRSEACVEENRPNGLGTS